MRDEKAMRRVAGRPQLKAWFYLFHATVEKKVHPTQMNYPRGIKTFLESGSRQAARYPTRFGRMKDVRGHKGFRYYGKL
jgi:hypothetical protein